MSDKEKSLHLAADITTAVLRLAELMEMPTRETVQGEEVKLIKHRLDHFAEVVRDVQIAVLYAAEEIRGLANVIEEAEDSPELEAARLTLEQYAAEIEAAKKRLKEAESRAGQYADLYSNLMEIAAEGLTEEQADRHREFKARITGKGEE